MYLVLLGELLEALPESFIGIRHHDESLRVDLPDLMLHQVNLLAAHHQEDQSRCESVYMPFDLI